LIRNEFDFRLWTKTEWQLEMTPIMPQNHASTERLPWLENFKAESAPILIRRFPRQFESNFWETLDRRFAGILSGSVVINFLFVAYLLNLPATREAVQHTEAIQERFARLVLDKSETEKEPLPAESPAPATTGAQATRDQASSREGNASGRSEGRSGGGRGANPAQTNAGESSSGSGRLGGISSPNKAEVGRAGILGLLSSSSEMASGEGVEDILGGNVAADMDKALSAGLARAGSGGGREQLEEKIGSGKGAGGGLRGGRETGGGNIDAMVEGLGEGKSKGVSRSGNIEFQESAPLIEVEEGGTGGGRSQDAVAAIVARHTAAIQSCYQSEIRRTPDLKGKIVVRFVITPQGTVESATIVSSTLNNARVEKCVINRILRWDDFGAVAPDKGKTTIRQVYTFGY
jgi:TonB family protein